MSSYSEKFWQKNWDEGLEDLDPKEYETTYVEMIKKTFEKVPDKTAHAIDADGYMHTGDVAIMNQDGYLTIVDRTKDMIIVGGFKVFSSKVEDELSKHPAIGKIDKKVLRAKCG